MLRRISLILIGLFVVFLSGCVFTSACGVNGVVESVDGSPISDAEIESLEAPRFVIKTDSCGRFHRERETVIHLLPIKPAPILHYTLRIKAPGRPVVEKTVNGCGRWIYEDTIDAGKITIP